jgi:hypothetical protein
MADFVAVPFACTIIAADPGKALNIGLNGLPYFEVAPKPLRRTTVAWDGTPEQWAYDW